MAEANENSPAPTAAEEMKKRLKVMSGILSDFQTLKNPNDRLWVINQIHEANLEATPEAPSSSG